MLYTLLTVSFLAYAALCQEEVEDESVVTLTGENFSQFISEHSKVLVEFYAPWCGHCKALAPEYESAAQVLHSDPDLDVFLAKVDATEDKELSGRYGVKGFPTLKYFTNGDVENPSDYSGGRTKDTIVTWLSKRALPAVSALATAEDVNTFKTKNRIVLLGCLEGDKESNPKLNIFYESCEVLRESTSCGITTDTALCGGNDAVLYRQFDEPEVSFSGDFTTEALTAFVNAERFPLVDQIGPDNYKDYMDRKLPLVWIAVDADNTEQLNSVLAAVNNAAKANKGKLSFTWIDNNKYAQHVGNLGITNVPGLIIVDEADKYIFDGDVTSTESVDAWFDKYSNDKLSKFLKTEAVPESNDEPVFVLVGSQFNEVIGQTKDVFVEYYAPWCGHCKRLAPEYEKVGEYFQTINEIVVAKVDATENDTPEKIQGFPTLIWYPAGTTVGTKYEGGRTAEDIITWIKENTSKDISSLGATEGHTEL